MSKSCQGLRFQVARQELSTSGTFYDASNHLPSILKNIPKSIQKRLNTISSSEDEFGGAKDEYQKALEEAGYTDTLTYDPEIKECFGNQGCKYKFA